LAIWSRCFAEFDDREASSGGGEDCLRVVPTTRGAFKCSACGDEFPHEIACSEHLSTHLAETTCSICYQSFGTEQQLKRHIRVSHVRPNNYHLKVIQKDGKYHCSACNKPFTREVYCMRHFSVHLGKTKCFICGKVLSKKSHLIRHIKTIHQNLSLQNFVETVQN
jgi:Zinc finger, C2H2 type